METNYKTFGEFLSSILTSKNITITQLANLTNTKSRNSIQRLLKDESSIEVIESFKLKLMNIGKDWLGSSEFEELERSIEVSRLGKDVLKSREILLNLCTNNRTAAIPLCYTFSPADTPLQSLKELFQSYSGTTAVTILIYDSPLCDLTDTITSFITGTSQKEIKIEHIINVTDNPAMNAELFTSIYKLINYKNYNAYYYSTFDSHFINDPHNTNFTNLVVINKISEKGIHSTDLIKLDHNKQYSILYNNPGDELFYFYLDHFNLVKSYCQPIRRSYVNENPLDKIISICEYLLMLEKSSSEYLIKQNMCFQMIHTDISYQMLVDSQFLGLSEAHPLIQRLIQVSKERFHNYFHTDKMKVQLFTKRGLEDFVKNHNLSDHFYQFRDFKTKEVLFILKFILEQHCTNPCFKLYLMKEDYKIDNIEYIYYEDQVIYMFDSCSGYEADVDEGIITAKPFLTIYDDFIKQELIPKHTYPESETIRFLEELIGSLEEEIKSGK